MQNYYKILIVFFVCMLLTKESSASDNFTKQIDSLIKINSIRPFNGIILITQSENPVYSKMVGYANFDKQTHLR